MDGMVPNSEVNSEVSFWYTIKIPAHHWSLGELEAVSTLLGNQERKGPCYKVPHRQAVARSRLRLASISQGKVEVICEVPSGLSISNKIGQSSQYKGWSWTMQLGERPFSAWWDIQAPMRFSASQEIHTSAVWRLDLCQSANTSFLF